MPKKNSPGTGSKAIQLADGRWRAAVSLGIDGNGKRIRKYVYGASRSETDNKLRNELNKRDSNTLVLGNSVTLIAWLDFWAENLFQGRHRTRIGYQGYIRRYVRPTAQARIKLSRVTDTDIEMIYAEMRRKKLSSNTVAQMHRILKRSLKVATQKGRIPSNPAERVEPPRQVKFKPNAIDLDDARRLVETAQGTGDEARWLCALTLGPRQGERLAMGWDQVDFERGQITIDRELVRLPWLHGCVAAASMPPACRKRAHWCPEKHGGGLFVEDPKSEAGTRVTPLPPELAAALRRHRERQHRIRFEEGENWNPWTSANGVTIDLVFCQRNGNPIDSRRDWGEWKRFLKDAGVPDARVHDARHLAATVLLLMGTDPRVVMEIMGWSQISMLKTYQHVVDEMKRSAIGQASSFLAQPAQEVTEVISLDAHRKRRQLK